MKKFSKLDAFAFSGFCNKKKSMLTQVTEVINLLSKLELMGFQNQIFLVFHIFGYPNIDSYTGYRKCTF